MAINLRPVKSDTFVDIDGLVITEEQMVLRRYEHTRQLKAQAEISFLEAEAALVSIMGEHKSRSIDSKKVTLVRREITKIDEPKLKKLLGARLYNKITKPVLDRGKLESLISTGEVNIDLVASASTIVGAKPYLRVSEVVEAEVES